MAFAVIAVSGGWWCLHGQLTRVNVRGLCCRSVNELATAVWVISPVYCSVMNKQHPALVHLIYILSAIAFAVIEM